MRLLSSLMKKFIRDGILRIYDADGKLHTFGGQGEGPEVTIRLHTRSLHYKLFCYPKLYAPEAFMDGTLTIEGDSTLLDFLILVTINQKGLDGHPLQHILDGISFLIRKWQQHNPLKVAAKHAQHHYDLSQELYRLFLDADLNYSCAYFHNPEKDSLELAQQQKLNHAISKLNLKPGMTVAEIGSGWGSFAIQLAKEADVEVTAINVSKEQLAISRQRAIAAGVQDRVEFRELDFRELEGKYDRVVSVGMMEHVGVKHFGEYFGKIKDLLKDDGFAFIHCIGRMDGPGTTNPFVRKYIFPGGYSPALSEVFPTLEKAEFWVDDVELLRMHYGHTLKHWRKRFESNRDKIRDIYDDRFCRMWDLYLTASEVEFFYGTLMVFQLLISRRRDVVPITRDYMFDTERLLAKS